MKKQTQGVLTPPWQRTRAKGDHLDLESLWKRLHSVVEARVKDNEKCLGHEYPLDLRRTQMTEIKTLIAEIDLVHELMRMQSEKH